MNSPEGLVNVENIEGAVSGFVSHHTSDLQKRSEGNTTGLAKIGDVSIGATNASIDRSDPPLNIDSLKIERGKTLVLIGPNGAGKSTLFDAIMSRENAFVGVGAGEGAFKVGDSINPNRSSSEKSELRVSRLDQEEIMRSMNDIKVSDFINNLKDHFKKEFPRSWDDEYNEDNYDTEKISYDEDVKERIDHFSDRVLDFFEMKDFLDRKVGELSGGERTKLSLLTLFMSEPDVILLDEPTNHLDLVSIYKLLSLFKKYNENGVAIVCSSHVRWFLEEVGKQGVIEIEYDKEKGRRLRQSGSSYADFMKDGSREQVEIMDGKIDWRSDFTLHDGPMFQSLNAFSIKDSPLREVSLPSIFAGNVAVLTGKNGTGKTKLFETLAYNNEKYTFLPKKSEGVTLAYMPQSWPDDVSSGTVEGFFDWILEKSNPRDDAAKGKFKKKVTSVKFPRAKNIEQFLQMKLSNFSGGEQRLLWLLAASSVQVDMLILDEPTNHMDAKMQAIIVEAIKSFPGGVLLSTHDKNLMESLPWGGQTGNQSVIHWSLDKDEGGFSRLSQPKDTTDNYLYYLKKSIEDEARRVKLR
jgi:ATPase subunit of ABC transporter with duplicated ATPase domains